MKHVPGARQLQSLYEWSWAHAPDGRFALDAVTERIIDVNPAAEALVGYSREELIGMHRSILHPEAEREAAMAEFRKAVEEPSVHLSFHLQRKDNQCIPVMTWASKMNVQEGQSVVLLVCRNISEAEEREHRLVSKRWALSAYAGAAVALWQKHPSQNILAAICESITREPAYVLAWVGIAEGGPGKPVRAAAAAGRAVSYLDGLPLSWSEDEPWGRGPAGICIRTGQIQSVEDTDASVIYRPWADRARRFGIRSFVSVPLAVDSDLRGVLVVCAAQPKAFTAVAIEVFQHLAEQAAFGVHAIEQEQALLAERERAAKMEVQLTEAFSAMVAPIVLAMEMRDPYTTGHQSRVADIAVAIAGSMGWSEERLQGLRVAAQVHDIGKIVIPAEILTKPGTLNAAERAMIECHAETGHTILKDIPFPWPVAEIVYQHHEKLDGSGYPRGLKGDEILPEARVLAVADVVEAMGSRRPYRAGTRMRLVLRHIEEEAGSLLDAEAVRICADLFRNKRLTLPGWNRI